MAIDLLNTSDSSNLNSSRISGISNNAIIIDDLTLNQSKDILMQLCPGQVIEGKLMQIDGEHAKLLLDNNTLLNTLIESDTNLTAGQRFSFEIFSNNGRQLGLHLLNSNVSNEATAIKALEEASVKVTNETIAMVDSLMREGMPINKDMLCNINKELSMYPKADMMDVILLNKLSIDVNENNIELMNMYRRNNQYILSGIDVFADELTGIITDSLSSNEGSLFVTELLDLFSVLDGREELIGVQGNIQDLHTDLNDVKELIDGKEISITNSNYSPLIEVRGLLARLDGSRISDTDIREIKSRINNILEQQLLMKPSFISDKGYVKEYYKVVYEFCDRLQTFLHDSMKTDSALYKELASTKNSISFLNDINNVFDYVQLPLMMNSSEAHGDLYVYRHSRSSNEDKDEPVTALLHLSMQTLGDMNIFLRLENNKLSTRFCLEKEEMIDFIESHIEVLNKKLLDKGYDVITNVGGSYDSKSNVIDLIQGKKERMILLSNSSFDARA